MKKKNFYKLSLFGFAFFAALTMLSIIVMDYANEKFWWTFWEVLAWVSPVIAGLCVLYAWKNQPEK